MVRPALDDDHPLDPDGLGGLVGPPVRPAPGQVVRDLALDLGLTVRSLALGLVAVVLLAVGAWWWWHDPPPSAVESSLPMAVSATAIGPSTSMGPIGEVVAHAAGAVARPGVYTLAAGGPRVADLIDAAGGAWAGADLDRVNLAAPLSDGAQVHVPRLGEAAPSAPIGGNGATDGSSALVDLNTAGAEALETLPGVGPAIAAAILAHREENGPFVTVDDLIAVSGIGDAKLAAIRDLVTV